MQLIVDKVVVTEPVFQNQVPDAGIYRPFSRLTSGEDGLMWKSVSGRLCFQISTAQRINQEIWKQQRL
jgi:hypothetical protein